MSQDEKPPYGETVIPSNAENKSATHTDALTRADHLRQMIRNMAYVLAERHAFVSGYELED